MEVQRIKSNDDDFNTNVSHYASELVIYTSAWNLYHYEISKGQEPLVIKASYYQEYDPRLEIARESEKSVFKIKSNMRSISAIKLMDNCILMSQKEFGKW